MKKFCLSVSVAFILALSSGVVSSFAAEGSHMDDSQMQAGRADAAIDGYCPVCITKGKYMKGNPKFSTEYKGKVYYFPGFDQQKMFLNDPEAYIQNLDEKYKKLKMGAEGQGSKMPEGSH